MAMAYHQAVAEIHAAIYNHHHKGKGKGMGMGKGEHRERIEDVIEGYYE